MITKKADIPAKIRDTRLIYGWNGQGLEPEEVGGEIKSALETLYIKKELPIETAQGHWSFFTNRRPTPCFLGQGQTQEQTFHAVYHSYASDSTEAMFCGEYEYGDNLKILPEVAEQISRNVLEQKLTSFPPRWLIPGRGHYGLPLGFLTIAGGIGLVGLDACVNNNFIQAVEFISGEDLSIDGKVGLYTGGVAVSALIGVLVMHLANPIADITDRIRTRNFPPEVERYTYGQEAAQILLDENAKWKFEVGRAERYEKLRGEGITLSKENFVEIDDVLVSGQLQDLEGIANAEKIDLRMVSTIWPDSRVEC